MRLQVPPRLPQAPGLQTPARPPRWPVFGLYLDDIISQELPGSRTGTDCLGLNLRFDSCSEEQVSTPLSSQLVCFSSGLSQLLTSPTLASLSLFEAELRQISSAVLRHLVFLQPSVKHLSPAMPVTLSLPTLLSWV